MKNLKLDTCLKIFAKHDEAMYNYIKNYTESQLNMSEVSAYARQLRDENK